MSNDSGVSMSQVQYSICADGVKQLRKATPEEQQVACDQFEELTGIRVEPVNHTANMAIGVSAVGIALIVGIVIGYMICWYRLGRKNSKKTSKRSR